MLFVNPAFLFGLFAITIPVIIHLFNFRRFRKVFFTNVRFIVQLKQQTQKQSKIRHLIILLLRMLAIASLVFAFSQPYIPLSREQLPVAAKSAVSIFVDNSFSMESAGTNGTLLDEAVQKAREIVKAYKPSDQFQLLTNDFEGRHQRLVSKDEFLSMLDEVKPSSSSRSISEIITRQYDLLGQNRATRPVSFVISDFQESRYLDWPEIQDSSFHSFLVPLKSVSQGNIFIDSCWFDLPLQQTGQTAVLNSRIRNLSGKDLEKIPVKLVINGVQRSVASVDIESAATLVLRSPFTNREAGIYHGMLQITDYPVTFDDKFYFSFDVTSSIRILAIHQKEESRYINALFSQDSTMLLTNLPERSLDYSRLSSYNLIVINELPSIASGLAQELARFVTSGGTLCMIPSGQADLGSYNAFLSSLQCPLYNSIDTAGTRVVRLNAESPVYRDVFEKDGKAGSLPENLELPGVFRHFPILQGSRMQSVSLMTMLNGKDYLTLTRSGKGQVFQLASPLDPTYTDFPRQALFVPTFFNIALVSRPPSQLYHTTGTNEALPLQHTINLETENLRIKALQDKFEFIPEIRRMGSTLSLFVNGQITQAGNYVITSQQDSLGGLAFNFDRAESIPDFLSPGELETISEKEGNATFSVLLTGHKPVNQALEEMNYGTRLWKYFIWFALICLLAEVILLRIWKN